MKPPVIDYETPKPSDGDGTLARVVGLLIATVYVLAVIFFLVMILMIVIHLAVGWRSF